MRVCVLVASTTAALSARTRCRRVGAGRTIRIMLRRIRES